MAEGTFDMGEREPDYTTTISGDKIISFFRNDRDGSGAYDVIIGKALERGSDHFYIPDRTLGDLTNPGVSTDDMMGSLEAMCAHTVGFILDKNKISPQELHIALLHLRIKEQEEIEKYL